MFHKRIRNRKDLHAELIKAGHPVPHHEEDEESFNTHINDFMSIQSNFDSFSSHFDSSPSPDLSSSFDSAPDTSSFDGGGGASGGGGADGSW